MAKKKEPSKFELRTRRTQQIASIVIGVLLIITMVLSMFIK